MSIITLRNTSPSGENLSATFHPEKGMNLLSFKKGNCEVIDQSTLQIFEERSAGLGALIGPHFHRRHPQTVPIIKDESLFPHIALVKAKGVNDPFSHGIARYAPWTVEATETHLHALLKGTDTWHNIPLKDLEGQDFTMTLDANLSPKGLELKLTLCSDTDSLLGLHYYYALPEGKGTVSSKIRPSFTENGETHPIPNSWGLGREGEFCFNLDSEADFGLRPRPGYSTTEILLDAGKYQLCTRYHCDNDENSWQLYHPKGASFVCIEPLSAANPRKPCLTTNSLHIELSII